MTILIKSPDEIERMRVAGRLAAATLDMIGPFVQAGVTTEELDQRCHRFIEEHGAIPAPLNYRGFPKSICTSINHVVCHGIPNDRPIKTGDVLNIDVTVIKDGYHGDTSRMFIVGEPGIQARRLIEVTRESLWIGIAVVRPGAHLSDIGAAIQHHAEAHRYAVVRDYCGHGIGRSFHEDPQVLHYGTRGQGPVLAAGMTFTIEPMLNAGRAETKVLRDNWTVVTRDRSLSAQWEHTVRVTADGVEVLTLGEDETPPPLPEPYVLPACR